MSSVFGRNLVLSIFGESHGECVGIVLSGLPAGLKLDMENVALDMARRAPGRNGFSTGRQETDEVRIVSGVYKGCTTGAPLCGLIENKGQRSKDYDTEKLMARPSHADYTGSVRYGGFNDPRGGGHFSGRLTAPLVFAGAIARQWLESLGVTAGAHILQIGDVRDEMFDAASIDAEKLREMRDKNFPALDEQAGQKMMEDIAKAKEKGDSVGGIVECALVGAPAGWGSPFFHSVESCVSALLFSIPAVKGVEFGAGFGFARVKGSEANDPFINMDGKIRTSTNNNGGINGGITNGMPIIVRCALKPTPSIALPQHTICIEDGQEGEITVSGRHDPCIVPRALPAVEAAIMLAIMDLALERGIKD